MASERYANTKKSLLLVTLMILMTQVGYLENLNPWTNGEQTLDETDDVMETGGSSFVYANDKVSGGNHHTCAILDNGDVKCWGKDDQGQLGDGGSNTDTNVPSSTAIDLGTGRTAVTLSTGTAHTCAILDNGDVKCWGSDDYGQLGDGGSNTDTNAPSSTAIDLGTGRTAVAMHAGWHFTCAILDNGDVKCWGRDDQGQLGDGGYPNTDTNAPSSTAIDLGTGRTAVALTTGQTHACAILDNGDLKCWGDDWKGQLGDGGSNTDTSAPSSTAIDLGTGRTAVAIAAGSWHTCAILDNGDLKCWGADGDGQLGDGGSNYQGGNPDTNTPSSTPIDLGTGRTAVAVSAGARHTCAILDNGDVKCWGRDNEGQLGDGGSDTSINTPPSTPVDLGTGRTAVAVSAGDYHTCAILDNGEAKCWGSNTYGQLGIGSSTEQGSPVAVSGSNTWDTTTTVSSGSGSSNTLTASVEGADLITGQVMTDITFEYIGPTTYGNYSTWEATNINSPAMSMPGANMQTLVGDTIYFDASDQNTGTELWAYDTSNHSEWRVDDINSGSGQSFPGVLMELLVGDTLYFSADDGTTGRELWAYNTSNSSVPWQVADINSGGGHSDPGKHLSMVIDDVLYFSADDGSAGPELYAYNTSNGSDPWLVDDLFSGGTGSAPGHFMQVLVDDTIYFDARGGNSNGIELWAYNTSDHSTQRVTDINSGTGHSRPGAFFSTLVDDTIYFSATDGTTGVELWAYDTSNHSTWRVADINSGSQDSKPGEHLNLLVGDTIYFSADDGSTGVELWAHDTSNDSTWRVADINSGSQDSKPGEYLNLLVGDTIYFSADDGSTDVELWAHDTSNHSTWLVDDICSVGSCNLASGYGRPDGSAPGYNMQVLVGDTFYFDAFTLSTGAELWAHDTSNDSTWNVAETTSGTGSGISAVSFSMLQIAVGDTLYFSAQDGSNSMELWAHRGAEFTPPPANVIGASSCSSSPSLPLGLSIDSSTCTISGTPTSPSTNQTYTITAVMNGVTYQTSVWLSSSYLELTPSIEGADLSVGVPMDDITFQFNTSAASGSAASLAFDNNKLGVGNGQSCAILANGSLMCWGSDQFGALGTGAGSSHQQSPVWVNVGSGLTAESLAYGQMYGCVVLSNGSLKCWGYNANGQLGDGTTANKDAPVAISLGTGRTAEAVAVHNAHTCAILDDGSVKCWGDDTYGELGNGAGVTHSSSPPSTSVDLGTDRTAVSIDIGGDHSCAILDDGSLKCWGGDSNGQLGNGATTTADQHSPVSVDLGTDRTAIAVSAGWQHTCAILDNGSLKCWGSDGDGQLGNGATTTVDQHSPVSVDLGTDRTAVAVVAGRFNTCAILDDGSLKCWGDDSQGQLGNGASTTVDQHSPVSVDLGTGRTAVAVNIFQTLHTCAILDDASMKCWGFDGTGGLGNGPGSTTQHSPSLVTGSYTWDNTNISSGGNSNSGTYNGNGTAWMVKDIYSGSSGSTPNYLTPIGNTLYFQANDGTNGVELWKSDGTASGTVMVKDIYSGSSGSTPLYFTAVGNTLYFRAHDGTNGIELWKSDGTTSGTVMVKDIYSGSSGSSPSHLAVVGNTLYFSANDGPNGTELWKSDGTASGTVMVKDIYSGSSGSSPNHLTAVGNTLYFQANDGTNGVELWKSDGTTSGTVLVKDIRSGGHSASPVQLTPIGNTLFFRAHDGTNGAELWKSDGTTSGTVMVKDIASGGAGGFPSVLTAAGNTLYFSATDGNTNGIELWKSDGTTSGTVMVKDIYSGSGSSSPQYLTAVGNTVYFRANDGTNGTELWKSDGTTSGTVMVQDINSGGNAGPRQSVLMGNTLYFQANQPAYGGELWALDPANITGLSGGSGSGGGMTDVANAMSCVATPSLPAGLNIDSSTCTISGTPTAEAVNATYEINATISGITYLASIWLSSAYSELIPSAEGADLYLDVPMTDITFHYNASTATTTAIGNVNGQITTYGNGSTWKVADLHSGSGANGPGSTPMNKISYLIGDVHYFNAQSTTNGWELWAHNPSNGTLWEVTDISTASWGSYAGQYLDILVGDTLYFSANDDSSSEQLWAHDTSNDSTWKVIAAESNSGATIRSSANAFIAIDGDVFYFSGSLGNGYELIAYNTSNGTLWEAADIAGSTSSNPEGITASSHATIGSPILSDDVFVFTATSDYSNKELWAYNISNATAWEAYDINPGILNGGNPQYIAHIDDVVYFVGNCDDYCNPDIGKELFAYNATNQSGWLVADIVPGSGSGNPGDLMPDGNAPMVIDGTFYFDADHATHGWELWAHTPANQTTWLAADINSGYGDSKPGWYSDGLGVIDGRLYFDADDGINGRELWVYDPSNASSWRLTDIAPGSGSGVVCCAEAYIGDTFYVSGDDGINGKELWAYDSSNGSSWLVENINTWSTADSNPGDLILIGNTIYFRATDGSTGAEMYAYQPAEITSSGSSGTCSISPGLPTGLNIDSSTCTISGTPTVESVNQTYTVTAVISGVTYQGSVWLSASTFGTITSAVEGAALNLGEAMTPITLNYTVNASGGGSSTIPVTWETHPALPAGMSISGGTISGTPSVYALNQTYTIYANQSGYSTTHELYFSVDTDNAHTVVENQTIDPIGFHPPFNNGTTCWSVSPALPGNLSIDSSTGEITGSVNGTLTNTTYTVTANHGCTGSGTGGSSGNGTTYVPLSPAQMTQTNPRVGDNFMLEHDGIIYYDALLNPAYSDSQYPIGVFAFNPANGTQWMITNQSFLVSGTSTSADADFGYNLALFVGDILFFSAWDSIMAYDTSNQSTWIAITGTPHFMGSSMEMAVGDRLYADLATGGIGIYDTSNHSYWTVGSGVTISNHMAIRVGDNIYFGAEDSGGTYGDELYAFNTINESIWMVSDIHNGADDSNPGDGISIAVGDTIYFSAISTLNQFSPSFTPPDQLWAHNTSNGTTYLASDLNHVGDNMRSTHHNINWATQKQPPLIGDTFYFDAEGNSTSPYSSQYCGPNSHSELYAYNTANQTAWCVHDAGGVSSGGSAVNGEAADTMLLNLGDIVFFAADATDYSGVSNPCTSTLHAHNVSNGTTWVVEYLGTIAGNNNGCLGDVGQGFTGFTTSDTLYFVARAGTSGSATSTGLELWGYNIVNHTAWMVNDTCPGWCNGVANTEFHWVDANGVLYIPVRESNGIGAQSLGIFNPALPIANSSSSGGSGSGSSGSGGSTGTGATETFTFNLQSLADYDGDGLPNDLPSDYDAAEGPTPGLVADTDDDADGLLDTVETNTGTYVDSSDTGTDPLNPDTDGDGICDGPNAVPGVCVAGPDTNSGATVVDTPIVLLNNSDVDEIAPFYPVTGATYGLSPDLPTSMQFDASNGSIWGTPDMVMANTTYTMWANLTDGTSTSWTFFLEVLEDLDGDGMPDVLPGDYNATNDPIRTPGLEEDLDDDGDGYNDTAETDTGLYLDGNNTGTDPRDPDTDDDGICDGPGTVPGVCTAGPDLTPFGPPATVVAVNNTMIPSVPPYYAGSGLTYEYTPDLPAGLTIDPNNGFLMGVPTETIGNTTITVYANDTNGNTYSWDFTIEVLEDSDGDGSPDSLPSDYDGDNDSIRAPPGLTEDLDDDNDGMSDEDEILNGTEPLNPDTDGDGFCDGINAVAGVCFAGPDPYPNDANLPLDTDGDGLPDDDSGWTGPPYADDDDDNDGFPDASEDACGSDSLDASSIPADMDGDTICDGDDDDMDGDGIENVNESGDLGVPPGSSPTNPDTDGDGVCDGPESPVTSNCTAGPDMFPLDPSAWEDTDGDGYPNELFPPSNSTPPLEEDLDDDNDGWSDIDEVNCGSDPVNASDMPVDENGDGICDVLDLDWDDDGIPNVNETDTGVYVDESDTGTDPWNPDTDGDGFCDGPFAVYEDTEMICAAGPDPFPHDPNMPMDTDGDGLPNELPEDYIGNLVEDTDDDNDGYSDVSELNCDSDPLDATSTPTNDLDGDGLCDAEDPDVDGDGLSNETELAEGSLTSYMNADTDGDGVCDGPSAPALPAGICVAGPDAFPDDAAAWLDTDGDGDPDELVDGITTDLVLDTDDDNDGWLDEGELACGTDPKDVMSTPFDGDDDGICDVLDTQTLGYTINGVEAEMFEAYVNQSDFILIPNLTGMEPGLWTIEPALPAGLTFSGTARSGETGIISGIPTEASPMQNYTVTADNGRVNKSFTFGLGVLNDFDGDRVPDEPSLTGLEEDLDDDNDGHSDIIELKCGTDPVNQTSIPDVDEEGNCIEGRYAEDDSDDGNGFLMCLMPLCLILLLALLLFALLFRDKVILMGPEPENTTSDPAFLSGEGTKADPFVLKPVKALKAGSTVEAKETISIVNMSPEIRVNLLDLAESTNDKRFRMYEVDGTSEEPGFNLDADDEGRLRLRFVFDDSDDPTYPGGTYEGLLKLGKASVYLSWTVDVKEDKRKMNKIRKEQEAAEKAEKEAKEAEEKAKAEAEAKEAEEKAKAEAEAKAAEEKAAKEAEKKAKAEEKAAAAALAKKEKEEAAAKKKEEAAAKKAKAAEEKAAKEAEEAEAKAKAEAEAKAAEEKAAKEAEKKAKAEEKAAAAALAKKKKEEAAAKKKEEAEAKAAAAKKAKEEEEAKKKAEAEAKAAEEKAAKEAEKKAKAEEKAAAAAAAKKAKEEEEAKKKAEAEAKAAKEAEEKAKAEAAAKKKAEKKPAATKEAKKQEELQRVKKRAKSIDFKVIGEASSSELKSEVKKGATTLEVANAKDFAESGSAEINDAKGSNIIAWTGKDGNTLTGVSGVTRVFAAKAVLMVKDDLQVIKGIGPFIEEKLNALGITTYRQLANMTAKLETQVNEAIEFFPGRVKRDQWVNQAKILLGMDVKLDEKALKQAEELERIAQKAEGIDFGVLGVASASEADDLQKIKGIGPFIAEKLNALGIYKFSQLANMTSEIEEEVNVAIEFFPGRVKRDEWAKQAKEFAKD